MAGTAENLMGEVLRREDRAQPGSGRQTRRNGRTRLQTQSVSQRLAATNLPSSPFLEVRRRARAKQDQRKTGGRGMPQASRYQSTAGGIGVAAGWKCTHLTTPSAL